MKRLTKKAKRYRAIAILAPSADPPAMLSKEWDTDEKELSKTTLNDDKNDLKAIIDCSYDKNVKRASAAIVSVLSEKRKE